MTAAQAHRGSTSGRRIGGPRRQWSGSVAALTFLLLAVVMPIWLADPMQAQSGDYARLAALVAVVGVAAQLTYHVVVRRSRDLFFCFFWLFLYIFVTVPAMAQTGSNHYPLPMPRRYSPDHVLQTWGVIAVAAIAVVSGRWYYLGRKKTRRSIALTSDRVVSPMRLLLVTWVSLVAAAILVHRMHLDAFFTSRSAAAEQFVETGESQGRLYETINTYWMATLRLVRVSSFVPLFILIWMWRRGWRGLRSPVSIMLVVGPLFAMAIVLSNPMSNSRFWSGVVLFGLVTAFLGKREEGLRPIVLVLLSVTLLIGFAYLDYFRWDERQLRTETPQEQILDNGSYSVFQMTLNGVTYVENDGHQFGRQLGTAALFWAPRSILPVKSDDTGKIIGGEVALNWAAPLWTEFYVDFGLAGVFVGFFGVGAAIAIGDRVRTRGPTMRAVVPILASTTLLVFRGSLLTAMPILIAVLLTFRFVFGVRRRYSTEQNGARPVAEDTFPSLVAQHLPVAPETNPSTAGRRRRSRTGESTFLEERRS